MTHRRGIAALGNSEDIGTWSGTPHYLLCAGLSAGFLNCGLDLQFENLARLRSIWQLKCVLRAERPRGFQYGATFIDLLGKRAVDECNRKGLQEIVSHYQVLPARYLIGNSINTSFYIDSTLQDLFGTHEMLLWLNGKIANEAIDREIDGYRVAERIITMSSWVRATLERSYGIARDRIFTVLPGANLPEKEVKLKLGNVDSSVVPHQFTRDRKLRIGFTGKDWRRKGLPRLLTAVGILNRMDIPTEVVVIGDIPQQYRGCPDVRSVGFIDKSRELARFIGTIASCDLGCAPSHEEPLGIAPIEYLRVGVPVVCTAAGGLIDVCQAAGTASILLEKNATPEQIAVAFEGLAKNPDRLRQMRAVAWERKEYFGWDRAVVDLLRIWKREFRTPSKPSPLKAQTNTVICHDA